MAIRYQPMEQKTGHQYFAAPLEMADSLMGDFRWQACSVMAGRDWEREYGKKVIQESWMQSAVCPAITGSI